ncbi:MAG: VWA domain-containing protein [Verrucomicrobiales bacterium]|nr:VWA domain-containing protein [Verrucomicrobiales bacterium]
MESILNHRSLLDPLLLSEFFTVDCIFIALGGVAFGVFVAKGLWYETIPLPLAVPEPKPAPEPVQEPVDEVVITESSGPMFADDSAATGDPRRIVYIMDISFSMTPAQFALSKEELKKAIKELNEDSFYQVIFFSGGARFAHQADQLPVGKWIKASTRNKNKTIKAIAQVRKSRGTTWVLPVRLAMNMETVPDAIFFHTDGEKKQHAALAEEIKKLVDEKGPETKVHTIALMSASARSTRSLKKIADGTGGRFMLVTRR